MSKNSKIILRYESYQNIIQQYLLLAEFKDKAADTMNSKRLTIMELCNYFGDNGINSFHDCQQKHVSGFLCSISALATSTISGKTFILRHFFKVTDLHFKWGFDFSPSRARYWFRQWRDFAAPSILSAFYKGFSTSCHPLAYHFLLVP